MNDRNVNTSETSKQVTIQEIAEACGVSTATVSRVLSGKGAVKKETSEAVLQCVKKLGYQYKSRVSAKDPLNNKKIMIIVDDLTNPFYISIIQGVSSLLRKNHYVVAVFQSGVDSNLEEEYIELAQEENYEGIIMITAVETVSLINALKKNVCPVVLVNRYIRSLELSSVCIDNFHGSYKATKYLIDRGHKQIAHLAGPARSTASFDRRQGYIKALEDEGLLDESNAIFYGDLTSKSGIEFAKYFVDHLSGYSAVFCANDVMAVSFIQKMQEYGYRIPDDISIVCFDDTPITKDAGIGLTTVSKSGTSMGEIAAEIMLNILSGRNPMCRKVILPPILNERDSVRDLRLFGK